MSRYIRFLDQHYPQLTTVWHYVLTPYFQPDIRDTSTWHHMLFSELSMACASRGKHLEPKIKMSFVRADIHTALLIRHWTEYGSVTRYCRSKKHRPFLLVHASLLAFVKYTLVQTNPLSCALCGDTSLHVTSLHTYEALNYGSLTWMMCRICCQYYHYFRDGAMVELSGDRSIYVKVKPCRNTCVLEETTQARCQLSIE
jgi:hypothetical protein